MRKTTVAFFPLFFLFLSLSIFQIPAVADGTAEHVPPQLILPNPLTPQLSADGKTLFNGLPLKAVVNDPTPSTTLRRIPAPAHLTAEPEAATASFSITYVLNGGKDAWGEECSTFPESAKAAFNATANIWSNTLHSSVPITIRACWASLSDPNILGYSGSSTVRDFSGATQSNTWYSFSLANALHGSDLSPGSTINDYDMHITYNTNFSWYFGTDGNTPLAQHDFMSVVLHEIAHGLNFSGAMNYASGQGSWGYDGYPNIYDVFMRDGLGKQLITYTSPSTALGSALVSNNIWFHGRQAMATNGNQRVKMYAPATWSGGSSYSHLDYATFNNTSNQLMVYAISNGESIHDPGAVTRGLLSDLGWSTSSDPPPPSSSSPWVLFQAAINAASSTPPPPPVVLPQWGVSSAICCSASSLTFTVTSSKITKKTYVANCQTAGTW
ncbi:MAG: hypothetical protein GQ559_07585, partial [Desulfobulbaceae bacterium]|nr:hypothetical protein [Desulfobulbaceae bacterium]